MTPALPAPLWSRGPDGQWRAVLHGRAWTLREPTGSTAWAMYCALQGRLGALGLYTQRPSREHMAAVTLRAGCDPDVLRLARQIVDWMQCDGVEVAGQFDRVFPAGRVAEVPYLAMEAWSVLDFFVAPGSQPPERSRPTTAPAETTTAV